MQWENANFQGKDNTGDSNEDKAFSATRTASNEEGAKSKMIKAPSITLPKGGGAIKSIDEKFSVNAVNGTAGISIPLPFSSARGFSPSLSLSYNSGSGNDVFGLGWSADIPSIKRKTANELPQYFDAIDSDTYIFSGAEDLVPEYMRDDTGALINEGADFFKKNQFSSPDGLFTIRRYRPRIEGAFARIERWTELDTGIIHWRTISKDNTTSLLGIRPQSRLSDPTNPNRIFQWFLDLTFDDKGNCALYQYLKEDGTGMDTSRMFNKNRLNGNAPFTNTYLFKIIYGNTVPYTGNGLELYAGSQTASYADGSFVLPGNFVFQTIFDYGELSPMNFDYNQQAPENILYEDGSPWVFRADPFSQYVAGFEIRTCRLCSRVLLYHYFDELPGGNALIRSMDFEYSDNGNAGFTFLSRIRINGFIKQNNNSNPSTYTSTSFPPLSFEYQTLAWNTNIKAISPANLENSPSGIDGRQYMFIDLKSEGLSGILTEQTDAFYYKSNLMRGVFTPGRLVSPKPSFSGLGKNLELLDLEGNGRKQLVQWQNEPKGFFELGEDGEWQPFRAFGQLPNIDFSDPNTRLLDLNGDGRADILITEDEVFAWYASEGKEGFEQVKYLPRVYQEEKGPAMVFSEPLQTIFLADMSGDGTTDIVRIRNGEICYWPNLGYGKFGAKVNMDRAPVFDHPDNFNPAYIRLADIDGSGAADVIYLGKNSFTVWLNLNGNCFSPPTTIGTFPEIDGLTAVSVIDLLGTGLGCLVWNSSLPDDATAPLRYIDLMNSTKPHILVSYKNNLGKEIYLEYSPSTQFYIADKLAGTPWVTRLHFVVHCVSKITSYDRIMKTRLASTYSYHHGYYDHYEKEFRGFGRVDQTDCEEIDNFVMESAGAANNIAEKDLHQPPVLTRTWYHTGAFLDKDRILRQFAHEYFQNPLVENLLPEPELPPDLDMDEWREALRSCKGLLLRREVYANDNSGVDGVPYLAEQHNALIKILQPRGENKYAVCLVHPSQSITYYYERTAGDPRIAHDMVFEVDNYGNVCSSASVVYPRLGTPDAVALLTQTEQGKIHLLFHRMAYTNAILTDPDNYRTPLIYSAKTYEVTALPGQAALEIFPTPLSVPYYDPVALGAYCEAAFPASALESPAGTLIEYQRTLYCSATNPSTPLAPTVIDAHGLIYESYRAAFNQAMLSAMDIPGFNLPVTDTLLQAPSGGAFIYEENYYWIPSGRHNYDTAHFFLSTAYTDPFGNTTTVDYETNYYLYILATTDAAGNTISTTGFNYRTLSPYLVTDMNGNRTGVRFDALGVVVSTFLMGKPGENKGDPMDTTTPEISAADQPTTILEYAIGQWYAQSVSAGFDIDGYYKPQPNYVHGKARTTHYYADDGTVDTAPVTWMESYLYCDGGGHAIVKKVQAPVGWIGNGRTILNNKGNPVKKYEPYITAGFDFDDEKEMVELGVTAILSYDAPGRVIRTDYPDGTFSRVEFDPWKQLSYDRNDTVIDSQWFKTLAPDLSQPMPSDPVMRAAWCAAQDYNTPSAVFFDTLGRPIVTQELLTPSQGFVTQSILDIQGNTLQVIDANANTVMSYRYDMLKHPLYQDSMDAGQRWILNNVAGKPISRWDERNHTFSFTYDVLLRPLSFNVAGGDGPKPLNNIYEQFIYGESLAQATALAGNLLGKTYIHYDQAGKTLTASYDFKGNPLSASRKFATDYRDLPGWGIANPDSLLNGIIYTNTFLYDALNRVTQSTTPDGSITSPDYNITGLLQSITVTPQGGGPQPFVQNIDYNARGQRNSILYGNNALTSYQYDVDTFRLIHLTTTTNVNAVVSTVQDLTYTYDPIGNIMQQSDGCIPTVFFNNYEVSGSALYEYDALYRLVSGTGREHAGQLNYGATDNWNDLPFSGRYNPNDNLAWQTYTQSFKYDPVGNIEQISHAVNGAAGWVRNYTYETVNNRLKSTRIGADTYAYTYHPQHGFITSMPHLQVMNWDFKDELQAVSQQKVNEGTPETTWYVYDASGQRVRKVTENPAGAGQNPVVKCECTYVGGIEIYSQYTGANAGLRRQTLHVMDDKQRIAMIESRNGVNDGTPVQLVRYQVSDHLGSSCLELNDNSNIISYEEYHPFGTTSFQAMNAVINAAAKRYRYTGKQRDEESGFNYHGARYYAPWLGRWTAPDPIGIKASVNDYKAFRNSPICFVDPSGTQEFIRAGSGMQSVQQIALNVDESLAVGEPGISPQEAMRRALDLGDRQFLEHFTNQATKGERVPGPNNPVVGNLPPTTVAENPSALIVRGRLGGIKEWDDLSAIIMQRVGPRLAGKTAGEVKAILNEAIRAEIKAPTTAPGQVISESLSSQLHIPAPDLFGPKYRVTQTWQGAVRTFGTPAAENLPSSAETATASSSLIKVGTGVLSAGIGLVVGAVTTEISMKIIEGNKFQQEQNVLNKANHTSEPPEAAQQRDVHSILLGSIPGPPGLNILFAGATRLLMDRVFDMVTEGNARNLQHFQEQNPGATGNDYEKIQDLQNNAF